MTSNISDDDNDSSKSSDPSKKLKFILLFTIFIISIVWAGNWFYQRTIHVYLDDARIDGEIVTISSRVAGLLTELNVIPGDDVVKDQILAQVDQRDAVLQREVLKAKLLGIESNMSAMRSQITQVDQETLGRFESETNRLVAAQAEAASLAEQLKQSESDYKRIQSIEKFISIQEIEHSRVAYLLAQERLRKAQSEIAVVRGMLSSAEGSRKQGVVFGQQLLVLARQSDEIRSEIKRRDIEIFDRSLFAPSNGRVVMTFVRKGEHVSVGQRILMFHDPEKIWVDANVKETDVANLRVGMKAKIYVDAYPSRIFDAEIYKIGQAATNRFALLPDPNPSGNFTKVTQRLPLRLKLLENDLNLRPGMMVEAYIETGKN
jgi:membrane fusion protein (multidrug efflux system)